MKTVVEIAGWVILASIAVLVIMNPDKFSTVIGAASAAALSESALLTGSAYGKTGYGTQGYQSSKVGK